MSLGIEHKEKHGAARKGEPALASSAKRGKRGVTGPEAPPLFKAADPDAARRCTREEAISRPFLSLRGTDKTRV